MKIESKVISSTNIEFFESELNRFYNDYAEYDVETQFCPITMSNNTTIYMALVIVRKGSETDV